MYTYFFIFNIDNNKNVCTSDSKVFPTNSCASIVIVSGSGGISVNRLVDFFVLGGLPLA